MTTYEQWAEWNERYNCLPYMKTFELEQTRMPSWEKLWEESGETAVLLESGKAGRYTYVGAEPAEWVYGGLAGGVRVRADGDGVPEPLEGAPESFEGAPLAVLRQWMAEFSAPRPPGLPKFAGG